MTNPELSKTVSTVLSDEFADRSLKLNVLNLVRDNLLYKDVIKSLIDSLKSLKDENVKKASFGILQSVDLNEITDTNGYAEILTSMLNSEKNENIQISIVNELKRLVPLNVELLENILSVLGEEEHSEKKIHFTLNAILENQNLNDDFILKIFKKGLGYPRYIQDRVIQLASKQKKWDQNFQETACKYLDLKNDVASRSSVLRLFDSQLKIHIDLWPALKESLKNDQNQPFRIQILDFLRNKKNAFKIENEFIKDLALNDFNADVREKAGLIINGSLENKSDFLLKKISEENDAIIRIESLNEAKKYMREEGFKENLLSVLLEQVEYKDENDFKKFFSIFIPYLNRSEALLDKTAAIFTKINNIKIKEYLINIMGKNLKEERAVNLLLEFKKTEETYEVQQTIINNLMAYSPIENEELYSIFIEEALEPSSDNRTSSLDALKASLSREEVRKTFEDVILNDFDEDLLKIAIKAYLEKNKVYEFKVLFEILKKDNMAINLRKRAVEEMRSLNIDEDQKVKVKDYLTRNKIGGFNGF